MKAEAVGFKEKMHGWGGGGKVVNLVEALNDNKW